MKTVQLDVAGMSCGHCVTTVRSALIAVEGVHEADVSLPGGRATVRADDGVEGVKLVQAVEQSGYRANLAGTGAGR
jgi:copper chaperone CopZ